RTRGRGRFAVMSRRTISRVWSARMPWTVALLRGQKVIARTKADGTLAVEGGRVEIRYRATDPRAYRASASNLKVPDGAETMSDAAVVAGEEVKSEGATKSAPKPARLDKKDPEP